METLRHDFTVALAEPLEDFSRDLIRELVLIRPVWRIWLEVYYKPHLRWILDDTNLWNKIAGRYAFPRYRGSWDKPYQAFFRHDTRDMPWVCTGYWVIGRLFPRDAAKLPFRVDLGEHLAILLNHPDEKRAHLDILYLCSLCEYYSEDERQTLLCKLDRYDPN